MAYLHTLPSASLSSHNDFLWQFSDCLSSLSWCSVTPFILCSLAVDCVLVCFCSRDDLFIRSDNINWSEKIKNASNCPLKPNKTTLVKAYDNCVHVVSPVTVQRLQHHSPKNTFLVCHMAALSILNCYLVSHSCKTFASLLSSNCISLYWVL